ncbi:MAG: redoxin domain-containing protein [Sphingobacterium sp.]
MKKIILGILAAVPTLLFAQEDFSLKGSLKNIDSPAKVFLIYMDGGERHLDSANIENGQFTYNGIVSEPTQAHIVLSADGSPLPTLNNPDATSLYLAKGVIQIEGEDLKTAKITGNDANKDFAKYKALTQELNEQYMGLNDEFEAASDEQKQDETFITNLQDRAEDIFKEQTRLTEAYVIERPNSVVTLGLLGEIVNAENLNEVVLPTFEKMASPLKNTARGKALAAKIEKMKKVAIGSPAPEFALPDTSGTVTALSSLRGKYVLIDFWASWCAPCRQENPNLVAAYNKFKDKNFTVFGVSLDRANGKEAWLKAIKDDQLEQWPQVSDLKAWQSEVVDLYGIEGIPQNFLIDPDGKIIASNLRGAALEEKLAEILE